MRQPLSRYTGVRLTRHYAARGGRGRRACPRGYHPLYASLDTALRSSHSLEHHVLRVWDFMSWLKSVAVQSHLCARAVDTHGLYRHRRLINDIVLARRATNCRAASSATSSCTSGAWPEAGADTSVVDGSSTCSGMTYRWRRLWSSWLFRARRRVRPNHVGRVENAP